ncbi:mitogen-activated protein kinase kinase kinase MLT, partial [Haematococcus lacustris]
MKASGGSMSDTNQNVHSCEVRLVLEYCDKGSLSEALDQGAFMGPSGLNYRAVLDTALDVAKAMLHLHSLNILHADLKARNVMLKSGGEGRTVVAKVADFGLSLKMEHMETHISSVFQGTMTHMAPEIMLEGRVSKAADVYAFGITLWELSTAGHPFKGVPRALLGHQITREALRPLWPSVTPPGFRALASQCWNHVADSRPSFEAVLEELVALRAAEPGDTPPLTVVGPKPLSSPSARGTGSTAAAGNAGQLTKRQQGKLPQIVEAAMEGVASTNELQQHKLTLAAVEGPHGATSAAFTALPPGSSLGPSTVTPTTTAASGHASWWAAV